MKEIDFEFGVKLTNSIIQHIEQFQKTFRKCTWCKDPYQWRKDNFCTNCGHDLRIDWNIRCGIYINGYVDKDGFKCPTCACRTKRRKKRNEMSQL